MLNELEEFKCYTGPLTYTAAGKRDTAWMRRFTFDMLKSFEGFSRVLTVVARGYMFKTGTPDIVCARRALRAWCSIPESKKASPREDWQFGCCFPELHEEFPELVDDGGHGWLYRHVHGMADFVRAEPERVSAHARKHCETLVRTFDAGWRSRVRQFQVPLFSSAAYSWLLSFDSILADALELGPLCAREYRFTEEQEENIQKATPPGVPVDAARALVAYYHLNKPEDSNWVVLPVTNFDGWFGTTSFSRRWLPALDGTVILRDAQNYGICRYRSLF